MGCKEMQSTQMAKSITVPFLMMMMLQLQVRSHDGCHYFVLAKYVWENPCPQIQLLIEVMSRPESHMPCVM